MKQVQDVIERLWDFIDKLDINTFGKFVEINYFYILNSVKYYLIFPQALRKQVSIYSFYDKWPSLLSLVSPSGKFLADNIVGSVVVFSLIFWIPLSILVHCVVRNLNYFLLSTVCHELLWIVIFVFRVGWFYSFLLQVLTVVSCLCFFLQDKRLDQQYEENTKAFYYPPSVSSSSVLCSLKLLSSRLAATLTKLIHACRQHWHL